MKRSLLHDVVTELKYTMPCSVPCVARKALSGSIGCFKEKRVLRGCAAGAGDADKLQGSGVKGFEWDEGSPERSSPPATTSGRRSEEEMPFPMCGPCLFKKKVKLA